MPFWVMPLVGGALIGLASLGLVWSNGRVAGISGILGGALSADNQGDLAWRYSFLAGMLAGGVLLLFLYPSAFPKSFQSASWVYIVAGLIVGFGTRMGNGCTSGHGVCGVSRFSQRSIVATITFMVVGMVTVYVAQHVLGGAA